MTKQASSMALEMETIEDMNQALRHLGWESADDLHSFAVHNDIERFEQLTEAFTRHRRASTAAIATERDALAKRVEALSEAGAGRRFAYQEQSPMTPRERKFITVAPAMLALVMLFTFAQWMGWVGE